MEKEPKYTINDLVQLRRDFKYWLAIDEIKNKYPEWNYQQIIDHIRSTYGHHFDKEIENDKNLQSMIG